MSLTKLLPKSSSNKLRENEDIILYTVLVEWGMSMEEFRALPIPVFFRLWQKDQDLKRKQNKKS